MRTQRTMSTSMPLPEEKKLTIIYNLEAGCLGPDGPEHIERFCAFAQQKVESLDADYIHWQIRPRHDKSLPEMQYLVANKRLSHDMASRYLAVFGKNMDEFEEHLHGEIDRLIEGYMGR